MMIRAYLCGHGTVFNGDLDISKCPDCVKKVKIESFIKETNEKIEAMEAAKTKPVSLPKKKKRGRPRLGK